MLIKHYITEKIQQAVCGNVSETSNEGESVEDFQTRITPILKEKLETKEDLIFYPITIEDLSKYNDNQLTEAYRNSKGLQEIMLLAILTAHKVDLTGIKKAGRTKAVGRTKAAAEASKEFKEMKSKIGLLLTWTDPATNKQVSGVFKSIGWNKLFTIMYLNIDSKDGFRSTTEQNKTISFGII